MFIILILPHEPDEIVHFACHVVIMLIYSNYVELFTSWNKTTDKLSDGMGGGPLAIFDKFGNTVVISPLDNYMSSSFWHENNPGGRVNWGVMGGVKSIPANYKQRFILIAASSINQVSFWFLFILS
jgi:hypothetical protein